MGADSFREWLEEIREFVAREAGEDADRRTELERREAEFEKWRLVHKWVHAHPFASRDYLPRSRQWREALQRIRDIGEPELIDWVVLQIEIARNLERGVQEMRPRKNGPCHQLILEYVGNRKRKALAVLHFARSAEEEGCYRVNAEFHAKTADILKRHGLIERDEEGNPVHSTDPMLRS